LKTNIMPAIKKVSPSPKRFTFPPKEELERVRKRIARPGYRRMNIGLLSNATEADRAKYNLCLNISRYQDKNNLTEKELAQRLGIRIYFVSSFRQINSGR